MKPSNSPRLPPRESLPARRALFVLALSCSQLAWSAEYYLSPTGNDSNPGTLAAPWKTLERLESAQSVLKPGDTVYFRGGNYVIDDSTVAAICGVSSPFLWRANGTATDRITYRNYQNEKPVILYDRRNMNCHGIAIRPLGKYLTIDGLTIRQSEASRRVALPDGINPKEEPPSPTTAYPTYYKNSVRAMSLAGSNMILRNCTLDNFSSVGMDIPSSGANVLVEHNNFINSGNHVWYVRGANGTYRYNTLDGSRQRPESGRFGIKIQYLGTNNNKIYGNVIKNIVASGVIFSGQVSGNEVFNNIFINAGSGRSSGSVVAAWTEDGAVQAGNKFYNNTAIGKTVMSVIGQGHTDQFSKIEVRNNIFYPSNRIPVGLPANYPTIANNIFFNISDAVAPAANRLEDPSLTDPLGATPSSARLRASSKAIDAATGTVPNQDFFQGVRPAGGVADIGAHEFGSTGSAGSTTIPLPPAGLDVR